MEDKLMRADDTAQPAKPTLTEVLRERFKGLSEPVAAFVNRLGIAPITITFTGLIGTLIGAMFLSQGNFLVGGLIILVMGALDALDGTMARLRGEATDFGAFIDSVTDRYTELLIFAGLLAYYLQQADTVMCGMVFAAAGGSVMVSYVKARAEALGFEAKWGILTRAERYAVLVPSLVLNYPNIGVIIVAILANITALQRIYVVRKQARNR
jgi:CDP-diacylglycerol--glycerol-3-phosphate 3-phosphatidyltransferase